MDPHQVGLPPIGGEVPQAPAGLPPIGAEVRQPDFRQSDTSPNELAPNTVGTFVSHLATQVNPIAAVQTIGKALVPEWTARLINKADQAIFGSKPLSEEQAGTYGPINALQHMGAAQGALFDKAKAAYERGDHLTAARHFVDYLTPLAGPGIDKSSDLFQAGKWAAGGGDAIGLGLAMFGPVAIAKAVLPEAPPTFLAKRPTPPAPGIMQPSNASDAAAVQFGRERGIPVDAATATGNPAVRGIQALADQTIGGSLVSGPAKATQLKALTRVGGELAEQAKPGVVTPEQAGANIVQALAEKAQGHTEAANVAYDKLRSLEQKPTNRVNMPIKPDAVAGIQDWQAAQLRRIVHEMDASGYQPATWVDQTTTPGVNRGNAGGGAWQKTPASGGAKVYQDIADELGSEPTRNVVQGKLEAYLGGGPETPIVKAALRVAEARYRGRSSVSTPELPPSAMSVPTRLEAARVTSEEMGFPVQLQAVKAALQPLRDQMTRQMPVTQQQANPGLKAIQNILDGPDYAALSQVDRDLSAIKTLAREHGGLAKRAVAELDKAVQQAAANGGPDVLHTLQQGRKATIAKHAALDVGEQMRAEPVQVYRQVTAPADSSIELLRTVQAQVPQSIPQIARAKIDELLALATEKGGFDHADRLYADWQRLGPATKKILYPEPGQVAALDQFFLLAKKLATNPNPSGTGQAVMRLKEAAKFGEVVGGYWNPLVFIVGETGAAGLSAILHAPRGIPVLTRALQLSLRPQVATAAQVSATAAELVKVAQSAGVPLLVPQAATKDTP